MQQIIPIVLAVFFILGIQKQVLFWCWLWQLKEYRCDRVRAHFQDIGAKNVFLTLIGYSALRQKKFFKFTVKAIIIGILSFLSGIAALILAFQIYLPQTFSAILSFDPFSFSKLNLSIDSVNLLVVRSLLLNIISALDDYKMVMIIMAVIFFIMPAVIFLFVTILNIISGIFKAWTIRRARVKIAKFSNLKVIGITGSYGKSTTKEILYEILSKSKKYSASGGSAVGEKILKTPANINTAIGIAQLILDKLDKNYEIFVVEMGAYKIGEIKEICDIVKPKIGIITAINEQHLALFGSIKNTIKAKFQLVDSLPKDGLAILNAGDANIQDGLELSNSLAEKIKARIKLYSVGAKSDVYAIGEANDRQNIKFKFISGADIKDFAVNITGTHNISNVLAAIIAAQELGMDLDEISQIAKKISHLDFTLKILAGPNGSSMVDDTYNANPDGVFAALNYIKNQRGRKIIVMSSLIELGSRAHEIHQKLGKEISAIAAKLFFLDNYYISDIRKGAAKNKESNIEIKNEKNAKKISEYLENELKSSDTVLFVSRGAGKILELLKYD
ncbi:MAG: UDP-N-acetylmuramoyl-tripeptide--D-alanyl-D-alanine ligase [bacterium]|nr:UDP-N-acetylmuramoyl-tripeptide--D-alanyl-D-alanine ligase [bacterium]